MGDKYQIRYMTESDIESLDRMQKMAYGQQFLESRPVLYDKIFHGSNSNFVLENTESQQLVGYCLSHSYPINKLPPLDTLLDSALLIGNDSWYLHDLSLDPSLRGQGATRHLLKSVYDVAQQESCKTIALVSVQNSLRFWQHQGFIVADNQPPISSYGEGAYYMVKSL